MHNVYNTGPEYGSGKDIIEGDIKMTPAQAAVFKEGGWNELVISEAWRHNHGKWQRHIPYFINSSRSGGVGKIT